MYNWSWAALAAYSVYYCLLEVVAGVTWTLFMGIPMWLSSVAFREHVPDAWAWAIGVHVAAWVIQVVVGHGMAEKRRPAIMASFFQSIVLAPLFVWFELLFVLGYRPELQARIEDGVARIHEREAALRAPLRSADTRAAQ